MKRFKWTFKKLQSEAIKYSTKQEFRVNNPKAWTAACKRRILDKICKHMVSGIRSGKDHPNFKWTDKKLELEAFKYKTRWEFQCNSKSAFSTAHRRGILDKICAHMELRLIYWSDELLMKEANKYSNRTDFMLGSPSAYIIAKKRKIFDKICTHMPLSRCSSKPEDELINIIKKYFPSIIKLRDRKVRIENKPYIKGFDIDGLVPELKLGIEFDGKRWHSFEQMRKDRRKKSWSDDDIRNYHEIKDAWFLTKGIRILHIKEEDWLKNKQACINKCLAFLNTSNKR